MRYTPCLYCHRRPSTKVVRSKPACQQCWTTAKREKRAATSAKATVQVEPVAPCPTECDPDCDASCHEAHDVPWKRVHEVGQHGGGV